MLGGFKGRMSLLAGSALGALALGLGGMSGEAMWLAPQGLMAQEPVSATLSKRLGEAADGFRTGRPVYFVAALEFPHQITGAFSTSERAVAFADTSAFGGTFRVFGPYVTPRERTPERLQRITGVTLTYQTDRGEQIVNIDPRRIDALFFSMSAVDKFVIPYYTGVYGVQYAQMMRESFGWRPPCHMLISFPCETLRPITIPALDFPVIDENLFIPQ